MREIKFRAWHEEERKMWIDVGTDGLGSIILATENMGLQYLKGSAVLMQATGLLDKSGVEIYEGDIVRGCYGKKGHKIYQVRSMSPYGIIFLAVPRGLYFYGRFSQKDTMEVIGNIYENPELLEGE